MKPTDIKRLKKVRDFYEKIAEILGKITFDDNVETFAEMRVNAESIAMDLSFYLGEGEWIKMRRIETKGQGSEPVVVKKSFTDGKNRTDRR